VGSDPFNATGTSLRCAARLPLRGHRGPADRSGLVRRAAGPMAGMWCTVRRRHRGRRGDRSSCPQPPGEPM